MSYGDLKEKNKSKNGVLNRSLPNKSLSRNLRWKRLKGRRGRNKSDSSRKLLEKSIKKDSSLKDWREKRELKK